MGLIVQDINRSSTKTTTDERTFICVPLNGYHSKLLFFGTFVCKEKPPYLSNGRVIDGMEVIKTVLTSYISLFISAIALLLGLYNWKQSLARFRAQITLEELRKGCWNAMCVITNDSSRSISATKMYIMSDGERLNPLSPTPIDNGRRYLYKHDGVGVAASDNTTKFPLNFSSYEAKVVNLVVTSKPSNKGSYLIIETAKRKHKIRITNS